METSFLPPFAGLKWTRSQTGLLTYGFQGISTLKFPPTLQDFPFAVNSGYTCGFRGRLQLRGQRRNRTALPEHLRRIELSMDCSDRKTISDGVHFVKGRLRAVQIFCRAAPLCPEETGAASVSRPRESGGVLNLVSS